MNGATIGSLKVDLGLNSAKFKRGLSDAERRMGRTARRIKRISAGFAGAAATLSAVAVRVGANIDAHAKLARSLGTTTASMKRMERAGELAGVSMSGIEQATKDLTRRLSQAASGTGPAVDALKALGLSASDLMAMPLDERVLAINSAIAEFIPKAQQAAVAGQLFGEEGSIAMARLDPATIRQATDEIERMGLAISEADASAIERANDQISKLGLVLKAAGQQIAVTVLPALGRMADAISAAFEKGKALRSVFDFITERMSGRVIAYATALGAVTAAMVGVMAPVSAGVLGKVADGAKSLAGRLAGSKGVASAANAAREALAGMRAQALPKMYELLGKGVDMSSFKSIHDALNGVTKSAGGAGGAVGRLKDELTPAQQAAKDFADSMQNSVKGAVDGVADALAKLLSGQTASFKDFFASIVGGFKKMLGDMISMALKSRLGSLVGTWGGGKGVLGGLSSVVKGFGSGGFGGAFGAMSSAFSGIGAGLGGIASAFGAALPVIGAVTMAISAFRVKTTDLDNGLKLTIRGAEALTEAYRKQQKSTLFGLIQWNSNSRNAAGADIAGPIAKAYREIRQTAQDAARSIGASAKAIDSYNASISVSTKGMNAEQATAALRKEMAKISDDLAGEVIGSFKRTGERATDTLAAMQASMQTINSTFSDLGLSIMRGGLASAEAARNAIDAAGGVQAFQQAAGVYFTQFYTATEQIEVLRKKLTQGLTGAFMQVSAGENTSSAFLRRSDIEIPKTIAAFKARVDALNKAGRAADAAKLISLAPLFKQFIDLQEAAKPAADSLAGFNAVVDNSKAIASQREGLLRRLTVDQAITVYERRYWAVVWADKMPVGVDYALADYAVNSGPGRAAKHLQQVIGVKADGVVGPITLRIAKSKDPAWVVEALCDRRLRFLRGLRIWRYFGKGWSRRVEGVRKDALADIEAAP